MELIMDINEQPKILIIDDDVRTLHYLEEVFKIESYKTILLHDSNLAIKYALELMPDLIITDVLMPGLNGFEVCIQLKNNPIIAHIPVIFITALLETEDRLRAFIVGGVDYISKPIEREEVLARVKVHLDLRKSRQDLELAHQKIDQSKSKIELLSKTDNLTSLLNRREFLDKMNYEKIRSLRSGNPFSILMMDVDHIKRFNDDIGHDCGDFILVSLANIIKLRIRKQDSLARWGGDEFILLLPETTVNGAQILAESIQTEIQKSSLVFKGTPLCITLTIGITSFDGSKTLDQCISHADTAIVQGKNSGRNQIVVME